MHNRRYQDQFMDERNLALELMKSIREIDCRINELKLIYRIVGDDKPMGLKNDIAKRIERLIETRFCLIYSFNDLVPTLQSSEEKNDMTTGVFEAMKLTYTNFKRKL